MRLRIQKSRLPWDPVCWTKAIPWFCPSKMAEAVTNRHLPACFGPPPSMLLAICLEVADSELNPARKTAGAVHRFHLPLPFSVFRSKSFAEAGNAWSAPLARPLAVYSFACWSTKLCFFFNLYFLVRFCLACLSKPGRRPAPNLCRTVALLLGLGSEHVSSLGCVSSMMFKTSSRLNSAIAHADNTKD